MVYRGEIRLSPQRIRAAIEALPYENPKLSAVAVGYMSGDTFAERLERALARSNTVRQGPKLIEDLRFNREPRE